MIALLFSLPLFTIAASCGGTMTVDEYLSSLTPVVQRQDAEDARFNEALDNWDGQEESTAVLTDASQDLIASLDRSLGAVRELKPPAVLQSANQNLMMALRASQGFATWAIAATKGEDLTSRANAGASRRATMLRSWKGARQAFEEAQKAENLAIPDSVAAYLFLKGTWLAAAGTEEDTAASSSMTFITLSDFSLTADDGDPSNGKYELSGEQLSLRIGETASAALGSLNGTTLTVKPATDSAGGPSVFIRQDSLWVPSPTGVAQVGPVAVDKADVDALVAQARTQYESADEAVPAVGSERYRKLLTSIVEYLVTAAVVRQSAADLGVMVMDYDVEGRLSQIEQGMAQQGQSLDALLREQGVTREGLFRQLRDQMLQAALREKVTEGVRLTSAELQDAASDQPEAGVAEKREARHILVGTEAEAEKVRALLAADDSDANWKTVAEKYSIDPGSKNSGGELGTFGKGRMVKAFEDAAFALQVGQISQPVKTEFGWHILEVTRISTGHADSGVDKPKLLEKKRDAVWKAWIAVQLVKAPVVYAPDYAPAAPKQ